MSSPLSSSGPPGPGDRLIDGTTVERINTAHARLVAGGAIDGDMVAAFKLLLESAAAELTAKDTQIAQLTELHRRALEASNLAESRWHAELSAIRAQLRTFDERWRPLRDSKDVLAPAQSAIGLMLGELEAILSPKEEQR